MRHCHAAFSALFLQLRACSRQTQHSPASCLMQPCSSTGWAAAFLLAPAAVRMSQVHSKQLQEAQCGLGRTGPGLGAAFPQPQALLYHLHCFFTAPFAAAHAWSTRMLHRPSQCSSLAAPLCPHAASDLRLLTSASTPNSIFQKTPGCFQVQPEAKQCRARFYSQLMYSCDTPRWEWGITCTPSCPPVPIPNIPDSMARLSCSEPKASPCFRRKAHRGEPGCPYNGPKLHLLRPHSKAED